MGRTEIVTRITFFTKLKVFLLTLILFTLIPILILLVLPIYLYRFVIEIAAKLFKSKELGKILSSRSAVFAVDDLYNKPRSTLVTLNSLQGTLDLKEFRKTFTNNVLEGRRRNEELLHPELQQYVSKWMGFYFWKWDKSFHIENHIKEYNGKVKYTIFNEDTALAIANELVPSPFLKNRSPWELFVFPNCTLIGDESPEEPKSAFMLRLHHSLADGNSIVKLITKDIGGERDIETATPNYVKRNICGTICNVITFPFRVPWDISKTICTSFDPINSQWHQPQAQLSRQITLAFSKKIPLSHIKDIRDLYASNLTAIVMEAFTGALRKLMMEQNWKIPKYINLISPLPVPDHPNKLRNHMTAGCVKLPISNPDPQSRLREIEDELVSIKTSTFPTIFFGYMKAVGGLLPCMTKLLVKQYGPTAIMTNFAGPNKQIFFAGLPGLDCMLYGGFLPGNIGIGFGVLSYNGNMRFTVGVDESILPKSKYNMNDFINKILDELDELKMRQT